MRKKSLIEQGKVKNVKLSKLSKKSSQAVKDAQFGSNKNYFLSLEKKQNKKNKYKSCQKITNINQTAKFIIS